MDIIEQIEKIGIVPVVKINDAEKAEDLAGHYVMVDYPVLK